MLVVPRNSNETFIDQSRLRGTLITWINRHTARWHRPIRDLTTSLRDGEIVLALLHSLNPDEVSPPWKLDDDGEQDAPQYRCSAPVRGDVEKFEGKWKRVVMLANHVFGVPRLLNVTGDFWKNECAMVMYLSEVMFRASRFHHVLPLSERNAETSLGTPQEARPPARESDVSSVASSFASS